jgi:hypothetical protein
MLVTKLFELEAHKIIVISYVYGLYYSSQSRIDNCFVCFTDDIVSLNNTV